MLYKSCIIAFSVSLISGCSTFAVKSYERNWIKPSNLPEIELITFESRNEVTNKCKELGVIPPFGYNVLACTMLKPNKCTVYLHKEYDEVVFTHEMLHCSGWTHKESLVIK